eukprot:522110-Alexandrium_andersonii.AAC.1
MHRCRPSRGSNCPLQPPAQCARPEGHRRGERRASSRAHSAHTTTGKARGCTRAACAPRR